MSVAVRTGRLSDEERKLWPGRLHLEYQVTGD